jgi:hypothetical protein
MASKRVYKQFNRFLEEHLSCSRLSSSLKFDVNQGHRALVLRTLGISGSRSGTLSIGLGNAVQV